VKVKDPDTGEVFDAEQITEEEGRKVKTKDGVVDAGHEVWILTHEDGTVSLCHDKVFHDNYERTR